ncbi:MAG: hypothetical protein ACERKU_05105 [Nitrospirota bacterium]
MSTVRHQLIKKNTPQYGADSVPVPHRPCKIGRLQWAPILCAFFLLPTTTTWASGSHTVNQEELVATITEYAQAVGKNDRVAAGQRDFVCLLKMAQQQLLVDGNFPDALSPIYEWCAQRRTDAHGRILNQHDRGLDNIWPGPGKLVDFADFQRFYIAETSSKQLAPSFFVMYDIARHEPDHPFTIEALESGTLPHASFPSPDESTVHAAPTHFVITTVSYPNPLTAPVSNGPGAADWVVPYKKVQRVIQSVKVKWVVLSDLKRLGFPIDRAVLDLPLPGPHGTIIPFVMDAGGLVPHSTKWFGPDDQTEAALAGVEQAQAASTSLDALMQLNRALMIAPNNKQVLSVFANQLYQGLLNYGGRLNSIPIDDARLAQRFNELYWTVKSQTDRFDLGLGMETGGKAEPTPADYLYRMIPVMEALASLEPGDFQNRIHLTSTYRWTNDQMAALSAPQELLAEVPAEQEEVRAEVLLELAWARIGKVAWNRHYDDPDIRKGYDTAKRAFDLTKDPLNKFTAAYAMAYSLAFHVPRDNQAMLDLLQEAKDWFEKIPGASPQSWAYMLENDTLKGIVETDPTFKSLLAAR